AATGGQPDCRERRAPAGHRQTQTRRRDATALEQALIAHRAAADRLLRRRQAFEAGGALRLTRDPLHPQIGLRVDAEQIGMAVARAIIPAAETLGAEHTTVIQMAGKTLKAIAHEDVVITQPIAITLAD